MVELKACFLARRKRVAREAEGEQSSLLLKNKTKFRGLLVAQGFKREKSTWRSIKH